MVKRIVRALGVTILAGVSGMAIIYTARVIADTLIIPNTFSTGQIADPAQVNANYDAIKTIVNGKIDNDNWDPVGPDMACANLDLTAPCVTSTFITDGAVDTVDVAIGAITKLTTYSGTSTNVPMANGVENSRILGTAYSALSVNSIIAIVVTAEYENISAGSSSIFFEGRLRVNGAQVKSSRIVVNETSDFNYRAFTTTIIYIVNAPATTFDIEYRDYIIGMLTSNYLGLTLGPGKMYVLEFKK